MEEEKKAAKAAFVLLSKLHTQTLLNRSIVGDICSRQLCKKKRRKIPVKQSLII
jgi:hypothetical protein